MPKKIHWGEMQGLYVAAGTGVLAVAAAVAAVDNFEKKIMKKLDRLIEENSSKLDTSVHVQDATSSTEALAKKVDAFWQDWRRRNQQNDARTNPYPELKEKIDALIQKTGESQRMLEKLSGETSKKFESI